MRILASVEPSPEQLAVIADSGAGYRLIRGAAGSGKTTTALLRLKALCRSRLRRHERLQLGRPVRVLVLTYNRTLEGYIAELAHAQVERNPALELDVTTFGRWAVRITGVGDVLDRNQAAAILRPLIAPITTDRRLQDFYIDEVEYALSRFTPDDLHLYLQKERTGRGQSPRVDGGLRRRLLDEVIEPYEMVKRERGRKDWNDLAQAVADIDDDFYDVIIVDEAQDFSANQVRAVIAHQDEEASTTFVLDAVQRIYPRHFTWAEVGIVIRPQQTFKLTTNHRNTAEIARFALPLVSGLPLEDDGSLPDFSACVETGRRPIVVSGIYSKQLEYMLDTLLESVDVTRESVGILQPRGGAWFDFARNALRRRGLSFCELTRQDEWPTGPEQIGLSTIHSAKGLEFDHVLLPGLNQEVTPHGEGEGDASLDQLRRLLAMGVGRARRTVIVGYKPGAASTLIGLLDPNTYDKVEV